MSAVPVSELPFDLASASVPHIVTDLPGPEAQQLIERDRNIASPSMGRVYPLVPKRGSGLVIEDVDGNRFLDFNAGIAVTSTGHCHPQVTAAIDQQTHTLLHYCSSDWYHPVYTELCERLAASAPVRDGRVFLANSGTEAVEAAIKLARYATGRPNVIAFLGAFHGRSLGSLSLTASKARYRSGFGAPMPGVYHAPYGESGYIERVIFTHLCDPSDVAAIVVEPIQGEGGYIVPPAGWLAELRALCTEHGIVLVADEVQSGVGRTGRMWAVEREGIEPDMLLAGKGLASGLPLAALIAREDLSTWGPGKHGSTFGGNLVACAAALATLDLVDDSLAANAARVGNHLLRGVTAMQTRCPQIHEVRGRGLMIGIEFETHDIAEAVEQAAFRRGLLVLTCGPSSLRLAPPLVVTEAQADLALSLLEAAIAEVARRGMTHLFARGSDLPVAIDADGCEIVDADGRRYLDGCGGAIVVNVGHRDAAVLDTLRTAATDPTAVDYVHATQFTTAALDRYADELAPLVPVDDARVYPVSGGSEAIETALKLARAYHLARNEPDRHVVVARRGSYHGNSRGALDVSGREPLRAPYRPWLGRTVHVSAAYPYSDPRTGSQLAAELDETIREIGAANVAAFVAEPIAGAALGASVPPDDYWPAIAAVCRAHGVLLVADEVMTGFGRTGTWFACDQWGVRPDILVAGKGASNGAWPLGLTIATGAVHDTVQSAGGFVHGFTWSHHPIGARVALAVLQRLRDDSLVERAATAGHTLHTLLTERVRGLAPVGEVRGRGLFAGIELVAERESRRPFPRAERVAERVTVAAKELGLLVYPSTGCADGVDGDVVLLGPPFVVTDTQLEATVDHLATAIGTLAS